MSSGNAVNEAKRKLTEMNEAISNLDPSVRAAAFEILRPYYFDDEPVATAARKTKQKSSHQAAEEKEGAPPKPTPDKEDEFFAAHDHDKPSDNVFLIVAWLYKQHGVVPISAAVIKQYANKIGLIVPTRPDNTMRGAKVKGKSLFVQQGKGWALTVSGQSHLKTTYGVSKGNTSFREDADQ